MVHLYVHVQLCSTLCDPWTLATRLLCPWDFPGKNTGVGCHFLLQGIFPAQGLSMHLMRWQVDSLPLNQLGSPSWFLLHVFKLLNTVTVSVQGKERCWVML